MKYYSAETVRKMLGVTAQTLRNWDKSGMLHPTYTKTNGYRYYSEELINEFTHNQNKTVKKTVGYARVSSKKQEDDLNRQVANLKEYLSSRYKEYEIITDIGSGINYQKPGLKKLLTLINNRMIGKVVVLYKDRLLGFGFELVEYLASINNVEIEVLDKNNKSENEELVEDLVQIVTVFSCKLQGRRKKKTKDILERLNQELLTE